MNSSFKNLSIVGFMNLTNLGLGLILFSAAAYKLPMEEFGIYSLLTIFLVWFSKFIDFGSNSSFVSKFLSKDKNYVEELINFKIISFIFTSFIASLTLIFIINYQSNPIPNLVDILIFFILGLFFYGINYLLFAFFQKEEKFFQATLLNFVPALIKGSIGLAVLLNAFNPSLKDFFGIFALSMAGSSIFLIGNFKIFKGFKFNFKISHFFKSFYLAGTSQQINESWGPISNFLAFLIKSLSDLSNYSFASKLSNVFSVLSYSIYTVILTSNAKRKKLSQNYNLKESLILGLILIVFATLGTLIAPFLINLLFQGKFNESIVVFGVLIFSGAITSIHKFLDNYFFVEEKSKTLLKITISKLVVFIVLSVLFINYFGIIGLALADLTVSIIVTAFTYSYIAFNLTKK